MSIDIQLSSELFILLILLHHALVKFVAEAGRPDHRVEHLQVHGIDGLLLKQSLIKLLFDPDLL